MGIYGANRRMSLTYTKIGKVWRCSYPEGAVLLLRPDSFASKTFCRHLVRTVSGDANCLWVKQSAYAVWPLSLLPPHTGRGASPLHAAELQGCDRVSRRPSSLLAFAARSDDRIANTVRFK